MKNFAFLLTVAFLFVTDVYLVVDSYATSKYITYACCCVDKDTKMTEHISYKSLLFGADEWPCGEICGWDNVCAEGILCWEGTTPNPGVCDHDYYDLPYCIENESPYDRYYASYNECPWESPEQK